MHSLLTAVVLSSFTATPEANTPRRTDDFRLEAGVEEAVAGGPVVIKVTLRYLGKEKVTILTHGIVPWQRHVSVEVPKNWIHEIPDGMAGVGGGEPIGPGQEISFKMYLHHRCSVIPAGKATIKLNWTLTGRDVGHNRFVASPSATLTVIVRPADAAALAELRQSIDGLMNGDGFNATKRADLAWRITGTAHDAMLAPFYFDLLAKCRDTEPTTRWRLLTAAAKRSKDSPEIRSKLIAFLRDRSDGGEGAPVISIWRSHKVSLTKEEVSSLMSSRNLRLKVLTYNAFSEQCGPAWRESLLNELKGLQRVIEQAK